MEKSYWDICQNLLQNTVVVQMGSYESYYDDVKPFLEENDDLGPATKKKMLDVLKNPQKNA